MLVDSAGPVLLWGGGAKSRLIRATLAEFEQSPQVTVFDPTVAECGPDFLGTFVADPKQLATLLPSLERYVVCIGGELGLARFVAACLLNSWGLNPIELLHPTSFLDPTARLGAGGQMMPHSVVHKFTSVGRQCIINTGATVDHDCAIGDGVHVMGSAALASYVEVGNYASIGTNATVLPGLRIGEGAYLGAGCVATRDVPAHAVVVGNPARILRLDEPPTPAQTLAKMWPTDANRLADIIDQFS